MVVWKFVIPMRDVLSIPMPIGAVILHVDCQGVKPLLWALVDPESPDERRDFCFVRTGHPIEPPSPGRQLVHRGSMLMSQGALVCHLFEYAKRD
jgi:hypothetical protein